MKFTILFFTIFLVLTFSNVYSQNFEDRPIIYVGGYIGYLMNFHNADFNKLKDYPNCCPQFTDGSGGGVGLGILLEYPLTNQWGITARFGFATLSGELTKEQKIGNTEIRKADGMGTGDIADAISNYSIKSNIQIIGIEPGVNFYPIPNLSLSTGFRLGIMNNSTFDQSEKLISPNNVVFAETGTKARNESTNREIPNTNTIQIHPFLGAGYELPIFKNASLTPEARYYFALNNISEVNWNVNSLQLGASIKFPVYKADEIKELKELKIIRDTTTTDVVGLEQTEIKLVSKREETLTSNPDSKTELTTTIVFESYQKNIPRDAKATASLKITGLNRDGTKQIDPSIVIEEIETEERFPILPYVFFKEGDANLKNTSMKLVDKSNVASFDPNKLPWETMDIYSNLLNIVGYRLTNSKSSITLTGTNNNLEKEKLILNLSNNRAEQVKDYLVNVWGIAPSRINIQSRSLPAKPANNERPDGREENQRVEISSSDYNITAPLDLKDIVRTANPPLIEVTPELYSELGIDKWDISITQKGNKLREYNGSGNGDKNTWDVEDNPIPVLEEPILVKLNYSDKAGKKSELSKQLKISQLTIKKKRFELKDDKKIERFSLILFDYDKSDLTEAQKRLLEDVKSKVKPNSKVVISGYADRTGEEIYNKELAAKRNAEVQKVLKVADSQIQIQNIGSTELLYNNSSPEGRSYCRTVKVIVETPVK
jgi:outer membrane protein OmpA-like peptidoglycan-associated protein